MKVVIVTFIEVVNNNLKSVQYHLHDMRLPIIVLALICINALGKVVNAVDNDCSKKWICNHEDKCVRIFKDPQNLHTYSSQNACRLSCGTFGSLWPQPTGHVLLGQTLFSLNPNHLKFNISGTSVDTTNYLHAISNIFISKVIKECGNGCNEARSEKHVSVRLLVRSNETEITWSTDESYRLDVITSGDQVTVRISGSTIFGVRHGLETLSQLMTADICEGLLLVKSVRIEDRPIYRHRGLLLDTSRNFIPVADIKRTIDGMAASKLNVFHWHITDSHSFPLEIPSIPQFTIYGAYGPNFTYPPNVVREIITYAKFRGIRIIIEIDTPSHAGNGWQWGESHGLGKLAVCVNKQPWRNYCIQPPCGQIQPTNAFVFGIFRDIYRHLQTLIETDETIHFGGDEVHFGCWNSSEEIVKYMHDHDLGRDTNDFLQLWAEFHQALLRVWDEERGQDENSRRGIPVAPKKVIIFSSHLTDPNHIENYLQKDRYIIQTWLESSNEQPQKLLNLGYELIMSTKNAWYFDHGFWGNTAYYTWKTAYDNRLPKHNNVLGGEACVWTELIDEHNLDSRVWPRLSAVAERLWSNPDTPATKSTERIFQHNTRLELLGISPEPIAPQYCILNEGQCT
ncbi:chitooligosaccharidolytic beta-N-acetylglucosaminidase [Contarinia nasturtii]|uniref:chitooligosaccharidolytic beta-N-acetylglucosaminidase n=1 Tax=Contarinia nasturtii TaxID=265458 RepID=UPI0012D4209B|nr:chitooligosaccharidolytic beta-N-acetylglucosaminidase [Contarinia nasturtii]